MSGSERNRLFISSYTFGPSFDGRPRPRATLTSTWAAIPALAALGAVSVAVISLWPSIGHNSRSDGQTVRSKHRVSIPVAGPSAPSVQSLLQAVTATPQLAPRLAVEGAPPVGEYAGVGQDELPATMRRPSARPKFIAPSPESDVGHSSKGSDRGLVATYVPDASPELLQPPLASEECAIDCDSNGVTLSAGLEESARYSPDAPSIDVQVIVQDPALVPDAPSAKIEQLGSSAIVEPQPAPNSAEDVQLASEALVGQGENSRAAGANELELGFAGAVAAPRQSERSVLVTADAAAQTLAEQSAGAQPEPTRAALAVRDHLARIDARYADKMMAAPAVHATAADVSGQVAANVEEIPILAAAGETALGSSSAIIGEDQLVSVRLGDLISLFQDKLERPLFVWMSTSSAATRFVTPETLAAAGLEVRFDPERRQIVLGVSD